MSEVSVLSRELSLGSINSLEICLRSVEDSKPAELSRNSIHSLVHLEIVTLGGRHLTLQLLKRYDLDSQSFREIYRCSCDNFPGIIRNHFVPGLRLEDMSHNRIMHGVRVTPTGEAHVRFILGHPVLMTQLLWDDLWTGTPFVKVG